MARKKEVVEESGSLISDLISGTEFNFIGQNDEKGRGSLSDKPKVETPLYALNCWLGGGLPLGSILEVYGPNAAGKSSLMYETLGNFQRTYPNGVAFIIDSEASTDDSRLRQLGVDPARAPRMGASTLEDGFEQIIKILKKMSDDKRYSDFPVFILWDTIAAPPTRAQAKTGDMYGGGMAERARILKSSLTNIFPLIEKQNVLLVLLNQVMAEIGGWRPGVTSAGGNALKHDVHMRLQVDGGKTIYDGVYATQKYSSLTVCKSKVSPIIEDLPIILDITKGGVVDRPGSLVWWMTKITPVVFYQGSWWSVNDDIYAKYKVYWDKFEGLTKFRQSYLYEVANNNPNFVDFLQLIWLDCISGMYTLQKEVCKAMRNEIETRLMMNLGISYEEIYPQVEESTDTNLSNVASAASEILGVEGLDVNTETGEVVETPESSTEE